MKNSKVYIIAKTKRTTFQNETYNFLIFRTLLYNRLKGV